MRPRLVATDLDGTLLRSDGTLSARTRAALVRAIALGVEVVVLTARPPRYLGVLISAGVRGVAVCANGALVWDLTAERALDVRPLALSSAQQIASALAVSLAGVGFAIETGERVVFEPAYAKPDNGDIRFAASSAEELWRVGTPIVKLLAWSSSAATDVLLTTARAAVGTLAELTHSGGSGLIECSAPGVTKAAALARLCLARGIAAQDVVAFGDMPNDVEMLRWAGLGYAMANAHPAVLAAAAARTSTNNEDGVAEALESLLA